MGIPLVYEPPASPSGEKPKPDVSAAAARSPIRRRLRPGSAAPARGRGPTLHDPILQNSLPPIPPPPQAAQGPNPHPDRETDYLSQLRASARPTARGTAHRRDPSDRSAPPGNIRRTHERNRRMLHEQYRRMRGAEDPSTTARTNPAVSPWHMVFHLNSPTNAYAGPPSLSSPSHNPYRPSLTPRFAPAHPMAGQLRPNSGTTTAPSFGSNATEDGEDPMAEGTMDASMPLLRRVGHRSVARNALPSRYPFVDGLGDRERSVDADDDDVDINDHWDTLLSTIPPDEQLPTPESSFTSASATTTSANWNMLSNSFRSPQAPATASSSFGSTNTIGPSNGFNLSTQPPGAINPDLAAFQLMPFPLHEFNLNCDFLSDMSDEDWFENAFQSDTETRPEPRERRPPRQRRSAARSARRAARPEESEPEPPASAQPENDGSANTSFNSDTNLVDLQLIHRLLERLSRREDIPNEWWATAGLARTNRNPFDVALDID
ncbi:hypothetical protein FQN57_006689 [Myotisia sp. PD_48]|nr:hypothetical protein FQN57_006689 [Myotisia sp. PD_48]